MMTYTEKKRSMFLGLPWTFTSYTVTDEIITINNGLLRKEVTRRKYSSFKNAYLLYLESMR